MANRWLVLGIIVGFIVIGLFLLSTTTVSGAARNTLTTHHEAAAVAPRLSDIMFFDALCRGLGTTVCRAVYDPLALPALVLSFDDAGNSSLLGPLVEDWVAWDAGLIPKRKREKPNPATLRRWVTQNTTARQLLLLRSTTSLAIGRMHRDVALAKDFEASASLPVVRQVFLAQLRRALQAIVSEFFISLQLIIDVMNASSRARLHDHRKTGLEHDPLINILASLKVTDTPNDVEMRIRDYDRSRILPSTSEGRSSISTMYLLDYARPELDHVFPASGRFWITFRSATGCHSLIRSCEDPEACRFVCNPRYLLGKDLGGSVDASEKRTNLRFIGLGSNNEWGWEQSTLRMFASDTSVAAASITTLDCTVKQWKFPQELIQRNIHFQTSRACVGQERSSNVIRLDDLKPLVLLGEGKRTAVSLLTHLAPSSRAERHGGPVDAVQQATFSGHDDVALLKIDVESHEHSAIPVWAKLELRDLRQSLHSLFTAELSQIGNPLTMIDFEKHVPSFFTVSMFQLELHEYRGTPMEPWLLQGTRLKQYLTSLGFIQVNQEPNFFHDCCFELLFVHYRFFIRSETWYNLEVSG